MYRQSPASCLIPELLGRVMLLVRLPTGGFAQFLNGRVKHTLMVLVVLARLGETRHLTPEPLERRDGFDNNADACGWDNTGHTTGRLCE